MHFTRLRLSGFKSFVDPLELRLEPGLTGIVGPNGCGKSNLVEALRWVMGENSARSMRGAGMDDVIFAGTARRPPRNLAEVSLSLDIKDGHAPSGFEGATGLDVTRRIEREQGSSYRINGRDVRAKDVQLLFADAATGAHSPALVSQGRVSALIAAKPKDRRAILEEAAGISGLHSRRKDAEQRLRAAENNLLRLQDILTQLENRASNLKRQARQAERYRAISGDIRKTDAAILYRQWREIADESARLKKALHDSEHILHIQTAKAAAMEKAQADFAALLPEKRKTETNAAAQVQRLSLQQEALEADERRRVEKLDRLKAQLTQITGDKTRELDGQKDAKAALLRLDEERERLKSAQSAQKTLGKDAQARLELAQQTAQTTEDACDRINQALAQARGRRASLEQDLRSAVSLMERLRDEQASTQSAINALKKDENTASRLTHAKDAIARNEAARQEHEEAGNTARATLNSAQEKSDRARSDLSHCRSALAVIEADIKALQAHLKTGGDKNASPIADSISIAAGYEPALGAALGSDLDAPQVPNAPIYWQTLAPLDDAPALPPGIETLAAVVDGPDALKRRLSQTGFVPTLDDALALAAHLKPGQRLATADGAMVRWDGLIRAAHAPTAAARRLQQKNRLHVLEKDRTKARKNVETAEQALNAALQTVLEAEQIYKDLRLKRDEAEYALAAARSELAGLEAETEKTKARQSVLQERLARLNTDMADAMTRKTAAMTALAELPAIDDLEADLTKKRHLVMEARQQLADCRAAYDTQKREAEAKRDRLMAIDTEYDAWALRLTRTNEHLDRLCEREEDIKADVSLTDISPQELDEKRHALADALEQAKNRQRLAADELAKAEATFADKNRILKDVQQELGNAREAHVRADAAYEALETRRQDLARTSGERFQCPPPDLLARTGHDDTDALPDMESLRTRLSKLKAERERLGAVNLQAEEELRELAGEADHLRTEKSDLETAIGRLRQAIGSLNREGRTRLLQAFEDVNRHFEELFQTLFGGGHAHLEMVESDDPLEAGIEIMASPPGKRLQILSLLSGGEQALTALSLIFAVFMTNPAPICVLDEVDAPLDEANVERLCDLLDTMIAHTDTRFLIITHNEVTMTRMHRLFGVTMVERGVSQLVSVDLERAESLLAAE